MSSFILWWYGYLNANQTTRAWSASSLLSLHLYCGLNFHARSDTGFGNNYILCIEWVVREKPTACPSVTLKKSTLRWDFLLILSLFTILFTGVLQCIFITCSLMFMQKTKNKQTKKKDIGNLFIISEDSDAALFLLSQKYLNDGTVAEYHSFTWRWLCVPACSFIFSETKGSAESAKKFGK